MVSALGLLDKRTVTADGAVDCPKTTTVEGREFRNSHDMALGKVPFRTVFAKSCNTAFAALAPKLGADGLAASGRRRSASACRGTSASRRTAARSPPAAPPPNSAAAAFGQGTTVVSPLAMAGATAAVARGRVPAAARWCSTRHRPPGGRRDPRLDAGVDHGRCAR